MRWVTQPNHGHRNWFRLFYSLFGLSVCRSHFSLSLPLSRSFPFSSANRMKYTWTSVPPAAVRSKRETELTSAKRRVRACTYSALLMSLRHTCTLRSKNHSREEKCILRRTSTMRLFVLAFITKCTCCVLPLRWLFFHGVHAFWRPFALSIGCGPRSVCTNSFLLIKRGRVHRVSAVSTRRNDWMTAWHMCPKADTYSHLRPAPPIAQIGKSINGP